VKRLNLECHSTGLYDRLNIISVKVMKMGGDSFGW